MLWGGDWQPINTIRLGTYHTIHEDNGKIPIKTMWYEPNFVKAKLLKIKKIKQYAKIYRVALEQLKKSNYCNEIEDALVRYVRAFDEKDLNLALVRLWSAFELLVAPGINNYDLITERCSFLFTENAYHKQILEHLREYRNSNIHACDGNENITTNCYQLQFYFKKLIFFHLNKGGDFLNIEEANNFLSLPKGVERLKKEKKLIEKAIKYRQGE